LGKRKYLDKVRPLIKDVIHLSCGKKVIQIAPKSDGRVINLADEKEEVEQGE